MISKYLKKRSLTKLNIFQASMNTVEFNSLHPAICICGSICYYQVSIVNIRVIVTIS